MDEWFAEMAMCLDIPINGYIHSNVNVDCHDEKMKRCDNIVLIDDCLANYPSKKMIDDSDCTLIVWDGYENETHQVMNLLKEHGKQGKILNVGVME